MRHISQIPFRRKREKKSGSIQVKQKGLKVPTKSISKLKKKAWALLSKVVRLKYADNGGYVQCYTCGKKKPIKEMQAGHGFQGRGNAILFEEAVIRPQCYGCNICCSGRLDMFTYRLRTELGEKRFEELWEKRREKRKFFPYELEEMIMNYKERLRTLDSH